MVYRFDVKGNLWKNCLMMSRGLYMSMKNHLISNFVIKGVSLLFIDIYIFYLLYVIVLILNVLYRPDNNPYMLSVGDLLFFFIFYNYTKSISILWHAIILNNYGHRFCFFLYLTPTCQILFYSIHFVMVKNNNANGMLYKLSFQIVMQTPTLMKYKWYKSARCIIILTWIYEGTLK